MPSLLSVMQILIPESEWTLESALFLLESESEILKGTGIGTGIGIREFGLGIEFELFQKGGFGFEHYRISI